MVESSVWYNVSRPRLLDEDLMKGLADLLEERLHAGDGVLFLGALGENGADSERDKQGAAQEGVHQWCGGDHWGKLSAPGGGGKEFPRRAAG